MPDPPNYAGAPRWVKVLGLIVLSMLVLLVLMRLTGHTPPHGGH
jgi:hypothetical protein